MKRRVTIRKNEDYTIDELGRYIFTKKFHLKRGYCCGCDCINCPYDKVKGSTNIDGCKR